jgi:hypothetical protein
MSKNPRSPTLTMRRVINAATRELIRELVLNPDRDYQPTGKPSVILLRSALWARARNEAGMLR